MDFQPEVQTKSITVQGFTLSVPVPYAEGHTLTEAEAAVLNQTLAENLRNNFGSQIKKSREDLEAEGKAYNPSAVDLQSAFDAYVVEYEFGAKRGGGGTVLDPIERKARSLAKEVIKRAIQNKGVKIKDVGAERITELADTYYTGNSEVLLEQAKEVLAADKRAQEALSGLNVEI